MKKEGIIIFATEQARNRYKEEKKKVRKSDCISCEIIPSKLIIESKHLEDEIFKEILEEEIKEKLTNYTGDL